MAKEGKKAGRRGLFGYRRKPSAGAEDEPVKAEGAAVERRPTTLVEALQQLGPPTSAEEFERYLAIARPLVERMKPGPRREQSEAALAEMIEFAPWGSGSPREEASSLEAAEQDAAPEKIITAATAPALQPPSGPAPSIAKGGRPASANPKTKVLQARVTEDEKRAFAKLAGQLGVPPSTLMRRMVREAVTGGPVLFDDGMQAFGEGVTQLRAVGRNLNQLAKAANRGDVVGGDELREELVATRARLAAVLAEVEGMNDRARKRTGQLTGQGGKPARAAS